MNANLDKIAQELYGKIQTRFPSIKIGDEQANVLSKKEDIPNARFFEFEYTEGGESLGTIAISLDPDDGIIVQVSGDLVNDDTSSTQHGAFKFLRSFRQFAKDRLLKFDIQNIGKSNLDKRDYQFQAKRKEPTIMENKLFGTSKVSYQDLGEARLIIKHSQHINPELPAGRTMHIESIYIQNAEGERFKYPFKHLNGARALAEHIKHGGNPYDNIGKYFIGLSEELNQLRTFKRYVSRQPMISEAMGEVTDRVIERIETIKKEIQQLQRPSYYESFVESFEEREDQIIPEEIVNDLVDRLTIRTFNEELKSVFPYIYNLIDESNLPVRELTADDILGEDAVCPDCYKDPCECYTDDDDYIKEEIAEIGSFESFLEGIVTEDKDEIFSPNKDAKNSAIKKLNKILGTELKGGPDGINARSSLKGLIDDPEFIDSLRDVDPNLDVRPLIQQYINHKDPDVASLLSYGGQQSSPAPAPEIPPEAPPAPEMPAAPEMPPEAPPAPEMPAAPEMPPEAPPAPIAESMESGLEEMLRFVSGFYNRENKNFPLGGQRIKIKVKKDFEDGMFPGARPQDLIKVLKFIDLKDPSSGEHNDVVRLAGVAPSTTVAPCDQRQTHLDELMSDLDSQMFENNHMLKKHMQMFEDQQADVQFGKELRKGVDAAADWWARQYRGAYNTIGNAAAGFFGNEPGADIPVPPEPTQTAQTTTPSTGDGTTGSTTTTQPAPGTGASTTAATPAPTDITQSFGKRGFNRQGNNTLAMQYFINSELQRLGLQNQTINTDGKFGPKTLAALNLLRQKGRPEVKAQLEKLFTNLSQDTAVSRSTPKTKRKSAGANTSQSFSQATVTPNPVTMQDVAALGPQYAKESQELDRIKSLIRNLK